MCVNIVIIIIIIVVLHLPSTLACLRRFSKTFTLPRHSIFSILHTQLQILHVSLDTLRPCLPNACFAFNLQLVTQSSSGFLSTCTNHLSLSHLTISYTCVDTGLTPRRLGNASDFHLSFEVTLHIHLTIILSIIIQQCTVVINLICNVYVTLSMIKFNMF